MKSKSKMTLREIIKILRNVQKYNYYRLVLVILFFACVDLIVNDNFESIYFFIGTAIALSGFIMLSGIFEKTGNKTKIEKKLFFLSTLFLLYAFSYILFIGPYSIFKAAINLGIPFWNGMTMSTYYLGIFSYFIGFATLILVLIQHYNQINLDAAPEEIVKKP